MSLKVVRDLAEHLKLLGYPHPFPLEALSVNCGCLASFYVVAEVLQWLAALLEPGMVLPGGVHSQDDRVLLIRSATEFFFTKSAIKLNPRKLYLSAAMTAEELQKITRLLLSNRQQDENSEDENEQYWNLKQADIGDKIDELRRARELSGDLIKRGAVLQDLLEKEVHNKEVRMKQTNRSMELATVDRTLKMAFNAAQLKLQSGRVQLENARTELNALNSKLQRKKAELERNKQRLEALKKIKPAHMAEYEQYENELKLLFEEYFQRFHVRDALKAQLQAYNSKNVSSVLAPVTVKSNDNFTPLLADEKFLDNDGDGFDDDDDDDDGPRLDDTFALDYENLNIRDDDFPSNDSMLNNTVKRPGTANVRVRPLTGKGVRLHDREVINRGKESRDYSNKDDDSFRSSGSDLDSTEILDVANNKVTINKAIVATAKRRESIENRITDITDSNLNDSNDFDLNSMDSILSISNITGELAIRPKTGTKIRKQNDEDF